MFCSELHYVGNTNTLLCDCIVFFAFSVLRYDYEMVLFFVLFYHNHRVTLSDVHIL